MFQAFLLASLNAFASDSSITVPKSTPFTIEFENPVKLVSASQKFRITQLPGTNDGRYFQLDAKTPDSKERLTFVHVDGEKSRLDLKTGDTEENFFSIGNNVSTEQQNPLEKEIAFLKELILSPPDSLGGERDVTPPQEQRFKINLKREWDKGDLLGMVFRIENASKKNLIFTAESFPKSSIGAEPILFHIETSDLKPGQSSLVYLVAKNRIGNSFPIVEKNIEVKQ